MSSSKEKGKVRDNEGLLLQLRPSKYGSDTSHKRAEMSIWVL